ncbi:MAG: hypothetical protein J5819_09205 [Eubacterium sp.]|nr:hypothetical protein [Eubacterium sp.]
MREDLWYWQVYRVDRRLSVWKVYLRLRDSVILVAYSQFKHGRINGDTLAKFFQIIAYEKKYVSNRISEENEGMK